MFKFLLLSIHRKTMALRRTSSCQLVVEQHKYLELEEAQNMCKAAASTSPMLRRRRSYWESLLTMSILFPLIFALVSYPVEPISYKYSNSTMPELVGVLAINDQLQRATKLDFAGKLVGAEAFAIDKNGHIYSGLRDGRIVKINVTDESFTVITSIVDESSFHCDSPGEKCSRPLGLDFDSTGSLIVADPFKGLLKINITTGEKELLARDESQDASVIPAFNNLVVLPNGSIFVTKLCKRNDFTLEILEGVPNGNLLHYDPVTNSIHTVVPNLFIPNGIVRSNDGQSILISETGKARILRYYTEGAKAGKIEVFSDNLPGLPDNIQPASKGGYWVAFPMVRPGNSFDFFAENAWLRRFLIPIRTILPWFAPQHVMVARIDEAGNIVEALHDQGGQTLYSISEAFEYDNELIIGSFEAPFIGKLKLNHLNSPY